MYRKNISGTAMSINIDNGSLNETWLSVTAGTGQFDELYGPNGLDVIAELNNKQDIIDGSTDITCNTITASGAIITNANITTAKVDILSSSGTQISLIKPLSSNSLIATTGDFSCLDSYSTNNIYCDNKIFSNQMDIGQPNVLLSYKSGGYDLNTNSVFIKPGYYKNTPTINTATISINDNITKTLCLNSNVEVTGDLNSGDIYSTGDIY